MKASLISRELIADSVELVSFGERMDGLVTIGGCDKNMPGMMMASIRTDLPSVFLYGGSIMPGEHEGREITVQNLFEGVGAVADGEMESDELDEMERNACPGAGSCGGMFTANTMASISGRSGSHLWAAPVRSPRTKLATRSPARPANSPSRSSRNSANPPTSSVRTRSKTPSRCRSPSAARPTPSSTCWRWPPKPASTSPSRSSTRSAGGRRRSQTCSPAARGSCRTSTRSAASQSF